ncbi:hypothetical protein F2P56_014398 [Juglans regia]|uniref:Uncharacterized protein LOC109018978 n=2 Tax=Juglans regia TaxID=51240 RepID=A0A2I4HKQ0_JUGRE|nr:uncharacterized protein LOC109018978 [Juglans regia]KAF5464314.1 hypothetical protein F2P56_014398 [Juglans regia]
MAFTASVSSKSQCSEPVSDDGSISGNESGYEDQLQEVYEKLYKECVKLRKLNKAHIEEIDFSKRENEGLQEKLDEILRSGKPLGDKSGLGYDTEKSDAATTSKVSYKNGRKTVFVRESTTNENANPSNKGKKSSHSGDKSLFKIVEEYKCGTVTFRDGGKADIIGRGEIEMPRLPVSREVLFVDGLKANLLSISQMCDNGAEYSCNSAKSEATDLWHQRLGQVNHKNLSKIAKKEMVAGLPELGKVETPVCGLCQLGKQVRIAHENTTAILTERPLELLHIDLMGPSRTKSLGGKKYILVMVDDFTRYSWVEFLREKGEAPNVIRTLCKKLQNEQGKAIVRIMSDHGREFENSNLESFCDEEGISQEFSTPITPQQNGVVERKNRVIQEMIRVMIHSKNVPTHFWGEAMNTACHIVNRVYP